MPNAAMTFVIPHRPAPATAATMAVRLFATHAGSRCIIPVIIDRGVYLGITISHGLPPVLGKPGRQSRRHRRPSRTDWPTLQEQPRPRSFLVLSTLFLLAALAVIFLFFVVLFLTRRIIGMLMLVFIMIARDLLATVTLGMALWVLCWSGASVNVSAARDMLAILHPDLDLIPTCQTLIFTPVVSTTLRGLRLRRLVAQQNAITLISCKPDTAHQRTKLSSPIRAVDGSIRLRTARATDKHVRLITQNGVRFSVHPLDILGVCHVLRRRIFRNHNALTTLSAACRNQCPPGCRSASAASSGGRHFSRRAVSSVTSLVL